MPRLLPSQFKEDDGFSDILFFAEDANTWRDLILQYREKKEEIYPSAFCASTLLAQKSVNICQLRELAVTESSIGRTLSHLPTFYEEMLGMADRHGILSPTSPLGDHDVVKVRILWHYCCIARLTALDDIERLIGRKGSPSPDMVNRFREWTATSEARLAILHAGHLLKEAINTKDLAFLVPR